VDCDVRPGGLRFRYLHAELPLETDVTAVGPTPWRGSTGRLETTLTLESQRPVRVTLRVAAWNERSAVVDREESERRLHHVAAWRARLTRLETPQPNSVARIITDALEDLGSLALLTGPEDEWLALQAGIPLYPALFGRDTITAGWALPLFDQGEVAAAGLTRLGRMQSNRVFDWRDEEPGRIPYQVRTGPLATLGRNPYSAYYADFASPLLFVIGLAHLFAWRGDKATLRPHWDVARRVLDWARDYGDRDQDGFLEYLTRSPNGTKNQGWKDSGNAILYGDGKPVPSPAGTCDLQGYWFSAQQLMAVMSAFMGEWENARALWRSARDLKQRFNRDWWVEEEQSFALALDALKRPATSVTSNVGQCLATGIIDDDHLPRVVGRLFAPDMFSGWGIRTLSTRHPAYNPLGYHVGTVWPVENATIVFGLRRFGFDQRASELAQAYFELAMLYERGRIPECVGGYARAEYPQPGAYPRANPVQTWNQSGYALLLQSLLGIQPVAPAHTLVVDPVLPPWLPELVLRNLRLAGSRATVRFARDASGRSHAEVLERDGPFHLVHQPPVESLRAGLRDRFDALVTTILHH
jgi:glycogen debranching enzyme